MTTVWAAQVAQWVKNPPAIQEIQEMRFRFPGQKDPLEKRMATHSSIFVWRIPMDRGLVGYSPWGRKVSDMTEAIDYTCIYNYRLAIHK